MQKYFCTHISSMILVLPHLFSLPIHLSYSLSNMAFTCRRVGLFMVCILQRRKGGLGGKRWKGVRCDGRQSAEAWGCRRLSQTRWSGGEASGEWFSYTMMQGHKGKTQISRARRLFKGTTNSIMYYGQEYNVTTWLVEMYWDHGCVFIGGFQGEVVRGRKVATGSVEYVLGM